MRRVGGHVRRKGGHIRLPRTHVRAGGGFVGARRADVAVMHLPSWTAGDTTDGLAYVTPSISVPAGSWLVVGVTNTGATAQDPTSVVATTGALPLAKQGASFTVGTLNNCRQSVYARYFDQAYTGTLTITFGATATACAYSPLVMLGGPSAGAIAQISAGATGTGTAVAAAALAAFENRNNVCVGFNVSRSPNVTPGAGFTEQGESVGTASPIVKIQSQTALNDPTSDATLASAAEWGAIALEFKAAS